MTCPYGKHPHFTKEEAREHLTALIRQRSTTSNPIRSHDFDIFICRASSCRAWHIGHSPPPGSPRRGSNPSTPPPPTVQQRRRGRTRHKHPNNPRKTRRGKGGHNKNKKQQP